MKMSMREKIMKKTVLVTCPRAPVVIEWIRIMQSSGWEVSVVDSLIFPIGRFSSGVSYYRVPSPKTDFHAYKSAMIGLIGKFDLVIPTCEDIFFLSFAISGTLRDSVFMPDHKLLLSLHDKYRFRAHMNEHVAVPETRLITRREDIRLEVDTVLKPVFSRFGRSVIRRVDEESVRGLQITREYPWIQQRFIHGNPICNYAIIDRGVVVAHSVYRPKYLLNGAASTYFEGITDVRCDRFIEKFASDTKYHGQVAFDFIDDGRDLYVLECNPRATSGLHRIAPSVRHECGRFVNIGDAGGSSYRVGMSLYVFFGFGALLRGKFGALRSDYDKATDVLRGIPFPFHLLPLCEMMWRSIIYGKPLTSATTFDIEYDGESLD